MMPKNDDEKAKAAETKQLIDFWGFSSTADDYFKSLKNPSYDRREINRLMDQYDRSSHPTSRIVCDLLSAVSHFRSATDPNFKTMREESKTDKELLAIFNDITAKLKDVEDERTKTVNDKDSHGVLTSAIKYSVDNIKNRLSLLEEKDDKLYDIYTQKADDLRSFLSETGSCNTP